MNKITSYLVIIAFLLCGIQVSGQVYGELNKVIPPSPQLSQFAKYGDYPVDHSTGIPSIVIPLYEITTAKLKLPISISYHASGFKINDQSGTLGLGWSLQAGGRISRSIQGSPDEQVAYPTSFKNEIDLNPLVYDDFVYLHNASINEHYYGPLDTEYDIFNFSMDNDNGKFVLARGVNGNRIPTPFPFRPLKFESNSAGFNSTLDYIEITNEQGTTYRFGRSKSDNQLNIETANVNSGNRQYTSGWFLSEVISYDKSETIKLIYTDFIQVRSQRTDICVVEDDYQGDACQVGGLICVSITPNGYNTSTYSVENTSASYNTKILKEIRFSTGKVVFNYSNDNLKRLLDMQVFDVGNQLLRKIAFSQVAFTNHAAYTKLSQINISDAASAEISKYLFDYNESIGFPFNGTTGDLTHTSAVDYWGFYNGKSPTGEIVPRFDLSIISTNHNPPGNSITQTQTVSYGNRDADETSMQTFILKKITYPTGGTTEFEYEANKSQYQVIGGLRIRRIISNAGLTGQLTKRYIYGQGENGQGELIMNPFSVNAYMQTYLGFYFPPNGMTGCYSIPTPTPTTPCYSKRVRTISSDFVDGSGLLESTPVFYTDVAEYNEGQNELSGKTTYEYELPVNGYGASGFSQFIRMYAAWQGGHLKHKHIYKKENGSYYEIEKEDNYYTIELTESLKSLKSVCKYYGLAETGINNIWNVQSQNYPAAFESHDYSFENGRKILTKKVKTTFNGITPVVEEQFLSYGSFHNNPTKISVKNSFTELTDEELKYPADLSYPVGSVEEDARQKLTALNNMSALLENKKTSNGKQILWVKNSYKDFDASGTPFLEKIWIGKSGVPEERVKFVNYQYGNLVQQSKTGAAPISYVWSYNKQFPIAEIQNADYSTVVNLLGGQAAVDDFAGLINPDRATIENFIYPLRVNLPNARISTFTYQPLVGITSKTDARGMTTYYEYDSFQRLKAIKDQNLQIVEQYDYHYKQP